MTDFGERAVHFEGLMKDLQLVIIDYVFMIVLNFVTLTK